LTPFDLSKAFDSAVKAPLWIFFAVAVGFGLLLLNPSDLMSVDDRAAVSALTGPPALWFVLFSSLFASSLVARSALPLARSVRTLVEGATLRFAVTRLAPIERATLALFEIEASRRLMLVANADHVNALRNAGFIEGVLIGRNLEWGQFQLRSTLESLRRRKPHVFRKLTKATDEVSNGARQSMNVAFLRARALG